MPERLVATLTHYELTVPFPIQAATIPDAMAGRDVLGKARTGSGKTLAFGLPILARLADLPKPGPHQVHALVLVPTRELAMQVGDALEPYAHATQLTYRLVAGGLSMSKQIMAVERGVHLVVATPGRLADLVRRGHIDLSHTSITVLDEADHMAEMGFGEEIAEILDKTPNDAQRLLFSATLDGVVDDLVRRYMHNPVMHDVTDGSAMPTQRHVMISIPPHEKYQMATRMAAREGRTMCFVRTKLAADRIAADMRAHGVLAVALHGDRSQAERNFVMVEFRSGRLPVLVATDVAARGIHVDAVDLVIQIDPPADYRDYTHRSGRTGRAGADGLAVMLVLPHQRNAALRVLDAAGIDAEDAAFRTIDAAALAKIDALTGARQPSGVPVIEPLPVMRPDRRGGRERQGGDSRGGRERPTRGRQAASTRDDAAFAAKRDHLTAKERELADRERALAAREQQLAQASAAPARAERPQRFERTDRPERAERTDRPERTGRPASSAPQSRVGWARSDDSRTGGNRGNRDDSRGGGSRGAGYQGNRPDSRGSDASGGQRSSWAPRSDAPRTSGYQGNRPDSRGSDAAGGQRSSWAPRSDAPRASGYQGNRPDSRGSDASGGQRSSWAPRSGTARSDAPRTTGYQGNRPDSRGSDASGGQRSSWAPRSGTARSDAPSTSGYQGNRPDSRGSDASGGQRSSWAPRSDAPRTSGYQGNRPDSRGDDRTRAPRVDGVRAQGRDQSPTDSGSGDSRRTEWQNSNPGERPAHKSKTAGRQPPGSRRGKARPKKKD